MTGTSYWHVDQRGVAVLGEAGRRRPSATCGHVGEAVAQRGELGLGGLGAGLVVDDDLGGGEAGLGEVLAELVDAHLGAGVGDVVVVLRLPPNAEESATTEVATSTQAKMVRHGWAAEPWPRR